MKLLEVVLTCAAAVGCHRGAAMQTLAQRWPADDPTRQMRPALVVVGDSIAKAWRLPGALNHALGGQKIQGVLAYFGVDALAYHPEAVLIEGGVNDLKFDIDSAGMLGFDDGVNYPRLDGPGAIDVVISDRYRLLTMARENGVRVFFAALTPVDESNMFCTHIYGGNASIQRINAALEAMCSQDLNCTYVDTYRAVGAKWSAELYEDCVHPNAAGFAAMSAEFDQAAAAPRKIIITR